VTITPASPLHLAWRDPASLIATWFGLGLLPIVPGTWASLLALPLAWVLRTGTGAAGFAVAIALTFGAGWWATGSFARVRGVPDPGEAVVDEVVGQWLVLLAAPVNPLAWIAGFLLFRLFDIWKPWPVRWADRHVKGGLGIMLDDILAAGYALLVLAAAATIVGAWRVHG
jgi:phosphatidylglycerophosphatase A